MSTSDKNLVERWFIRQRSEGEDNGVDGEVIYSDRVGVPDNWRGQWQWAAMKTTAAIVMAVGADNYQLPWKTGHTKHLNAQVQRSKSSLLSCWVKCQECMGST